MEGISGSAAFLIVLPIVELGEGVDETVVVAGEEDTQLGGNGDDGIEGEAIGGLAAGCGDCIDEGGSGDRLGGYLEVLDLVEDFEGPREDNRLPDAWCRHEDNVEVGVESRAFGPRPDLPFQSSRDHTDPCPLPKDARRVQRGGVADEGFDPVR